MSEKTLKNQGTKRIFGKFGNNYDDNQRFIKENQK
jgi:hypothetical protein